MTQLLPIYMDYMATTPTDKSVVEKMLPYFYQDFGNPHSRSHSFGWKAEDAVEKARGQVAALINADPRSIVFTSGATESNNLAIKGVANFYKDKKRHIITSAIEHKCVLDTCRHLKEQGFDITYLPVDEFGMIDLNQLQNAIRPDTALVSIMLINNEIGTIQAVEEIGKICRSKGVFFHTDAAQAFGKIPIDVIASCIDLLSISGHKIYGPKGVGALYVGRNPRVRLDPIINGGGQERGMRSGTLPTPLIVGLGAAAELANDVMQTEYDRVMRMSTYFINQLLELEQVYLNGHSTRRLPYVVNMSFSCIEGESMIGAINKLAVSSGSACTSESLEGSYVLKALGVDEELAHTSIRFSFGRSTTMEDVEYAVNLVKKAVQKLRDMSPLWEMVQAGIDLKTINWQGH